jgi:hypothetical protein
MNIRLWIRNRRKQYAFASSYWLKRYQEKIWLLGDGRSGTTWVSGLLNHDGRYREMFEPLHPKFVEEFSFLKTQQYQRPGTENPQLEAACADIFSGKFTHQHTDFNTRSYSYRGLLIKDIFANLLCRWAVDKFPAVRPVFLVRNPFAVALSKQNKSDWFWSTDPTELLQQPELREDYLLPYEDLIYRISEQHDFILNQVLIWSIIHYVPTRQFAPGMAHFAFYEHMLNEPEKELASLLQFVRKQEAPVSVQLDSAVINKTSLIRDIQSKLNTSRTPLMAWKNQLDTSTIDSGLQILDAFELAELYDSDGMPRPENLCMVNHRGNSKRLK